VPSYQPKQAQDSRNRLKPNRKDSRNRLNTAKQAQESQNRLKAAETGSNQIAKTAKTGSIQPKQAQNTLSSREM